MNVPKLRFKEFDDEWLQKDLGEISKIYDGIHQTPNYIPYGIPFVSVEDINDLEETNKFISKSDFEKEFKIKPQVNDILMTRITAGIIGATSIVKNNNPLGYYVSLALIRKNKDIDVNYLNQYINCFKFKKELNKRIIHVAFPKKINLGDIGKCKVSITNINEQQKIGKMLNILDKKIELQTKKIEDLKLFKLCIYRRLFSNLDYEVQLKDICKIEKGQQVNNELLIENGNYYMINGGISPSGYIDKYNSNENTITISEGGNSCGYVNFNKNKFWCGGHCYKVLSVKIDNNYLYHNLKFNERKLMNLRVGSGLPNIQKKDIENYRIKIHTEKEQLNISTFLDKYDSKIELEEENLNKLCELKKGLMQSLFV